MIERREVTRDMYISELQKDGERTRTLLEEFRQDIICLVQKQDGLMDKLTQMASDERAARVAAEMRFTKVEDSIMAAHARLDTHEDRIACIEKAPGNKAVSTIESVWKITLKLLIATAFVLLGMGLRGWILQLFRSYGGKL